MGWIGSGGWGTLPNPPRTGRACGRRAGLTGGAVLLRVSSLGRPKEAALPPVATLRPAWRRPGARALPHDVCRERDPVASATEASGEERRGGRTRATRVLRAHAAPARAAAGRAR